jgi:hypothetical protein
MFSKSFDEFTKEIEEQKDDVFEHPLDLNNDFKKSDFPEFKGPRRVIV